MWPTWMVSDWEVPRHHLGKNFAKQRVGIRDLETSEGCLDVSACQNPLSAAFLPLLFLPVTTTHPYFLQRTPVPLWKECQLSKRVTKPRPGVQPQSITFWHLRRFSVFCFWESPAAGWGVGGQCLSPSNSRQRTQGGEIPCKGFGFPTWNIRACLFFHPSLGERDLSPWEG